MKILIQLIDENKDIVLSDSASDSNGATEYLFERALENLGRMERIYNKIMKEEQQQWKWENNQEEDDEEKEKDQAPLDSELARGDF